MAIRHQNTRKGLWLSNCVGTNLQIQEFPPHTFPPVASLPFFRTLQCTFEELEDRPFLGVFFQKALCLPHLTVQSILIVPLFGDDYCRF